MTRWEALLEALGVDADQFELHQSKFDLSPRDWLRSRLEELAEDEGAAELVEGLVECGQPCCRGVKEG